MNKIAHNQWNDLSSDLPIPGIRIAFSNMSCSIESYGDLSSLCDNVGLDSKKLVSINQVHSSKIISVKRAGHYESSDGIINVGGNLVCSIKVADCLPIYFINRISRTIGLVHAGWRGLSLGIINEYINNVKKNNERASDNYVFIGPSIKKCCFKIQSDVLSHFDSRFYSKINDKHYQVDLQKWAVNQIMNLNIKSDKIFVIDKCTYCNKDLYESFRRDGDAAGRMYALLGWLE